MIEDELLDFAPAGYMILRQGGFCYVSDRLREWLGFTTPISHFDELRGTESEIEDRTREIEEVLRERVERRNAEIAEIEGILRELNEKAREENISDEDLHNFIKIFERFTPFTWNGLAGLK